MNSYRVTYSIEDEEKVVIIQANNNGQVFNILKQRQPGAFNIKIERIDDD
jgi:hypothetical protein